MGTFVAILMMFQVAPTGVAFFPDSDPRQIWVTLEGSLDTSSVLGYLPGAYYKMR